MSIEHAMERIGRIVAADQGLTVNVRGELAYATPGAVNVPAIETYAHLGKDAERMLHGLLDHECAHASDTDFTLVEKSAKVGAAFKHLLNAIEDGYIEGRQGRRFFGCQDNLRNKNTWFWTRGHRGKTTAERIADPKMDLWSRFLLALTTVVRPHGGQTIAAIKPLSADVHAMLVEVEDEVHAVAKLYDKPRATAETYKIAERIYKHFEDQAKDSKSEASMLGEGEGEGELADEEVDGDGETAPAEPDGDGSAKSEGEDKDEEDKGKKKDKKPSRGMELKRWEHPGSPLNPEEAIHAEIKKVFEQPDHVRPYIVFSHEWDAERDFSIESHDSTLSSRYERLVHEATEASDALVNAFEVGLRSKRERRPVANSDEGEVDVSLLAEYATGAASPDRIFCDYVAEDDRTAAVSILVDCSGSMGNGPGEKSYLAKLTAIAIHRALLAVQIPHEVSGFTTLVSDDVGRHEWCRGIETKLSSQFKKMRAVYHEAAKRGTDFNHFARGGGPDGCLDVPFHAVFKNFGSDDGRGLEHICGLAANLDGEGVLWQARRLARRPENRRVMFVLSDGLPAGSHDNAQGHQYLKEAVQRVIEAGIEVYGIGMQSHAVKSFYPRYWVCQNMADLSKLAFGALSEVLLENRQERAWVNL